MYAVMGRIPVSGRISNEDPPKVTTGVKHLLPRIRTQWGSSPVVGGVCGDPGLKQVRSARRRSQCARCEPTRCTAGDTGVFGKEGADPEYGVSLLKECRVGNDDEDDVARDMRDRV